MILEGWQTKMAKHKFTKKLENGTWNVKCMKTQGSFNTSLWNLERVKRNICPCCNEAIKSRKKVRK